MTTNNDDELQHQCLRRVCTGVVREYEEGGVREVPEAVKQNKLSSIRKIKRKLYSILGKEYDKITWYECSLCGRPHDDDEIEL